MGTDGTDRKPWGRWSIGAMVVLPLAFILAFALVSPLTRLLARDVVACGELPPVVQSDTSVVPACDDAETVARLDAEQADALSDTRDTLLRLGIAPLSAGAAYLTWRRTRALEAATSTDRDRLDDELYTKAVEQTGHDSPAIRLGGLFALEQLALRSEDRYAANVYEVFVYFLKEQLPTVTPEAAEPPARPATDVVAVVDILTRNSALFDRHVPWLKEDGEPVADSLHLRYAHLDSKVLAGLQLDRARLTDRRLDRSALLDCSLAQASLTNCSLPDATLTACSLNGATLTNCRLGEAVLSGCSLHKARLTECWLLGATLTDCELPDATLTECMLRMATLTECGLEKATLTGCFLSRARLEDCWLNGATLTECRLGGSTASDLTPPASLQGSVYNRATDWAPFDLEALGAVRSTT